MTGDKFGLWWQTIRPKTLIAGASPVILGLSLAYRERAAGSISLDFSVAAATVVCALLLQIGANLANDYFDYIKGADTEKRIGPVRPLPAGLLSKREIFFAMGTVFAGALIAGAYLTVNGGRFIFFIGITSMVMAVFYTAGPAPLGYIGLGELAAFVFFGPAAVSGTYYLQTGAITFSTLVVSVSSGLFAVALLTVNNYRDRKEDAATGKRTLSVRFGPVFAKRLYAVSLITALFLPCLLIFAPGNGIIFCLISGLIVMTVPVLMKLHRKKPGRWLNSVLGATGFFQTVFTIVFSAALLLG